MAHKKTGNIIIWIFAAVAIFLAVPFVFQEEVPGKSGSGVSIDGEGLLPVVSSENPLTKYVKKLAEFYGFKKKGVPAGKSFAKSDSYSEDDLRYMKDAFGGLFSNSEGGADTSAGGDTSALSAETVSSIRAAYAKGESVSLENGTVTTAKGLVLKPSKDGYSINGKFYKNGAYPSAKDKREIERALSKFHKEKAAQEGLRAAYVRNPDGSLSVQYMSPESLDTKMGNNLYASNKKHGSDYYRGARIISRKDSAPSSSGGASSSGSASKRSGYSSFDNIDSIYDNVSDRLKEHFGDKEEAAAEEENEQESTDGQSLSQELIANSNRAPVSLLISSQLRESPNEIPGTEYLNAPRVSLRLARTNAKTKSLEDFLSKYGVEGKFHFTEIQMPYIARGTSEEQIKEIMSKWSQQLDSLRSEDGLLRVFSPSMIPDEVFINNTPDPTMYIGYPRVPYMDIDSSGQPALTSFSEVFLNRTGLSNMFYAMSDPNGEKLDTSELEARYYALDDMRNENNKYLQMFGKNEGIKKKMPKVVFYLGKMVKNEGNVAVASPASFLYVYAPNMAPDFILGDDKLSSFREMPADVFLNNVNESGSNNIVIVNDEKIKDTLNKAGVKNVSVIETDRLSSGTPEDVEYVISALKDVVTQRVMADEVLKQEFIKAMKEASEKEKGK